MWRWPATNVFVDDYRALQVMNFAHFDLVKKKKKKGGNKTISIIRSGNGKEEQKAKTVRIDGNENDKYRIE